MLLASVTRDRSAEMDSNFDRSKVHEHPTGTLVACESDRIIEFEKLVRTRRSARGYKKNPVPRELIDEIISVAKGVLRR